MKSTSFTFFILIGLLNACTLTSTCPSEQGPMQALGTITGMALGGKIANDLTEDSSKNNLWTLAGVTLGAFLGNEIGASMDKTLTTFSLDRDFLVSVLFLQRLVIMIAISFV